MPDTYLIYFGIPIAMSLLTYIIRGLLHRLNTLEERMQHTTTEPQVRQLLSDKYDPLAQDIHEIKEMQQKLFDLYVKSLEKKS